MSPMFVPGPVDVAPEVLAAQARPMVPHRSQDFEDLFRRTADKLQKVFATTQPVYQVTASGSGCQEAAVRNFVTADVLCAVNGAFSERWFNIAQANGKQAVRLDVDWGDALRPDMLADALRERHYEALTIVHNETSTGVENPLPDLVAAAREASPDTLILVDAVSSLGGVKIEMDEWGLDYLFTSSQKCMALPPGMSFASASERAMQAAAQVPARGWYFDMLQMERHRVKDSTPMTPAMALIYALDVQLDRMLVEGLENRYARHAAMAARVQAWAEQNEMPPLADAACRSRTVTSVQNTRGLLVAELNQFLIARGMRLANGYGRLRERNFRIAHMGELTLDDVDALLEAISEFMGAA